jgi:tetratricopeptide (TPR) repeat protein
VNSRGKWRIWIASILIAAVNAPGSAFAVRPDDDLLDTLPADDDYVKGQRAFDQEDWQSVIDHMTKAVQQKPWLDDAYSLMGFAHRKLGDFDQSFIFYDKALTLNPHNRGALEYLGEAYLDLDQPERTREILDRLAVECERVAASFTDNDWKVGCEEWVHLNAAYDAHIDGRPRPEHE